MMMMMMAYSQGLVPPPPPHDSTCIHTHTHVAHACQPAINIQKQYIPCPPYPCLPAMYGIECHGDDVCCHGMPLTYAVLCLTGPGHASSY
jgi:hypothetical protein